jgi:uracil-DNA glycosylase
MHAEYTPRPLPILHDDALAAQLEAHRERLAACRSCAPGVVRGRPILSLARAPRVMLVGQAPGATEAEGGRPFAGRAGKTLFRWLASVGIGEASWREDVYMAAITRCYPGAHPGGRGDRVPAPHERAACAGWLDAELRLIRPRLIIPVGRLAIDRFLGTAPLDRLIGRAHEVEHVGGRSVAIPLPHPSGASSWIHEAGHRGLLDRALTLLAGHVAEARCAA